MLNVGKFYIFSPPEMDRASDSGGKKALILDRVDQAILRPKSYTKLLLNTKRQNFDQSVDTSV